MARLTHWINNYDHRVFLRGLVQTSEAITTFAQTLIVSFGVPLVLVLLLIVEHSRVMHGIALFEADHSLAWLAALSLVMVNFTLEFLVHYIEHREGYLKQRAQRASLRLIGRSLVYWLGFGRGWQAVDLSPAERYRRLLRLVTFTILALALAGSMRAAISQQSGAWYDGLIAVITESTLAEMSTWAGGLLFALAAVAGAQNMTAYLAVRAAEIIESMDTDQQLATAENLAAALAPTERISVAVAQVVHELDEEETAEMYPMEVSETDTPLPSPTFKSNGRHSLAN